MSRCATISNIKRTRFAASWNSARYYEQAMLNEAVPRLWKVCPLTRPSRTSTLSKTSEAHRSITDGHQIPELTSDEDDDEGEDKDEVRMYDINFDDDQPVAWLGELTEKDAAALEPFLELVTPSKIGLFSKPLSLCSQH
jgi:hypothetical protein